jgi:hypothetical protein
MSSLLNAKGYTGAILCEGGAAWFHAFAIRVVHTRKESAFHGLWPPGGRDRTIDGRGISRANCKGIAPLLAGCNPREEMSQKTTPSSGKVFYRRKEFQT